MVTCCLWWQEEEEEEERKRKRGVGILNRGGHVSHLANFSLACLSLDVDGGVLQRIDSPAIRHAACS